MLTLYRSPSRLACAWLVFHRNALRAGLNQAQAVLIANILAYGNAFQSISPEVSK